MAPQPPNPKRKNADSSLGSLGKALIQAGLLSKDKAKEIVHEERVHRKEVGREGLEAEKRSRDEAVEATRAEKREDARTAQEAHDGALDASKVESLIETGKVKNLGRGKRFHFVAATGRIPFVEVNEENQRLLIRGDLGIVEVPGPGDRRVHVVVEGKDRLERIGRVAPDRIRFWNR